MIFTLQAADPTPPLKTTDRPGGSPNRRASSEETMLPAKRGLLLALLLFAVLSLLALDGDLKVQHDSGIYITLAKSLATGQGYHTIFLAGHPPHTRYPPIFPLLLAPLIGLTGYHVFAMKLFVMAITLLTLYLLYTFLSDLSGGLMASLVVIFTATSHGILFYSQSIMTEIPYLCFSLLALLWIHRCSTQAEWSARAMALAVVLIPLVYLTRLIGVSLLLATLVYLVCDSPGRLALKIRRAMTVGGLAAIPAGIWVLRNWWIGESGGTPYTSDFHLKAVYASHSVIDGIVTFLAEISTNPSEYALHATKVVLFFQPWVSRTVLPLLLTLVIVGGFLWCAVRKRTILEYYIFFYIGLLLLLSVDNPQRYLVPLIPFIWYYFLTATGHLLGWLGGQVLWFKPGYQRGVVMAVKFLVLILLIVNITGSVLANTVYRGREGYYHVLGEDGYVSIIPWVKAHTSSDSVFVWAKPSLRFLWTDRQAVEYPRAKRSEATLHSIRQQQVDYVVVDAFSDMAQRYLRPMVETYPDYFRLVYEDAVSQVYQVVKAHLDSRLPAGG
jgi:4-amino-4-deoxy-L-arabinose transferase-like glycosyltransferase